MFYSLILFLINFIFCSNWTIDTTYSHIDYKGSHPFHTWNGKTNNINFDLNCKNEKCKINISSKLESFDSNNDSRDSNMLYYTESLLHPIVSIETDYFTFNNEFDKIIETNGTLSFHGINHNMPLKIHLSKSNNEFWGYCKFNIKLSEFNIERPILMMLKISDSIEIETKLKLIQGR